MLGDDRDDRDDEAPAEGPALKTGGWVDQLRANPLVLAATLVLLTALGVVALFHLDVAARYVDAHTVRAWAVRTSELNVSAYTGGANQRGPLWTAAFMAALHVADGVGYWFVIALLSMVTSAVAAAGIAVATASRTASAQAAVAIGAASWVYLVLGPEEFSRTLFSRNISGALTTAAFAAIVVWSGSRRPSRLAFFIVSAIAVGLAVQTMPTSALAATVLGAIVGLAAFFKGGARAALTRSAGWGAIAATTCMTAPAYYAARGDLDNFVNLYWRYNKIYSAATTRPLTAQAQESARAIWQYYSSHPLYALSVASFVILVALRWRSASRHQRLFDAGLLGWWIAELGSVALSQRFFGHYFVLPFLPMAIMGGCVLHEVIQGLRQDLAKLVPILGILTVAYGPALPSLASGVREARAFRGIAEHADTAFLRLPPERRAQRALVDTISTSDDHLQAWAHWTGFYDELDRPPATRYNALSWFVGWVYGGPAYDAKYVLPGTFERWEEDVRRTPPQLFLIAQGPPDYVAEIPPVAGAVAEYLETNLSPMFGHFNGTLHVDRRISTALRELLSLRGDTVALRPITGSGPTGGRTGGDGPAEPRSLTPARRTSACELISVTLRRDDTPDATAVVEWFDEAGAPMVRVAIAEQHARTERLLAVGAVTEADAPIAPYTPGTPQTLQVLVVGSSATVFLDGEVVGMMRTTGDRSVIGFSSTNGTVLVTDVSVASLASDQWRPCGD